MLIIVVKRIIVKEAFKPYEVVVTELPLLSVSGTWVGAMRLSIDVRSHSILNSMDVIDVRSMHLS